MSNYLLSLALLFADYGQTNHILDSDGRFQEGNPIINHVGSKPYFASVAVINTALYLTLPDKYADMYFNSFNFVQVSFVGNNALLGVGFKY